MDKQNDEKKKLILAFKELSFEEKKVRLNTMLENLKGKDIPAIELFSKVLENIEQKDELYLIKIYIILIEALYYTKNESERVSIEKLSEITNSLNKIKSDEYNEDEKDPEQELEKILASL